MREQEIFTEAGIEKLHSEIKMLEHRLSQVVGGKGEAAQQGNLWHDNFAWEQLEREERILRRQLTDKRSLLRRAQLIERNRDIDGTVDIGTRVEVELDDGDVLNVTIGGHGERDPSAGVISYQSPLAAAIKGAREGEVRTYRVGDRLCTVTVRRVTSGEA